MPDRNSQIRECLLHLSVSSHSRSHSSQISMYEKGKKKYRSHKDTVWAVFSCFEKAAVNVDGPAGLKVAGHGLVYHCQPLGGNGC